MKTYKTVTKTETVTRQELESYTCDICSKPIDEDVSYYCTEEVTFEYRKTTSYHGSGDRKTLSYDICPTCFNSMIPKIKEIYGIEPHLEESDW